MLRAPFKDTVHRSHMEVIRDRWTDEIEAMQVLERTSAALECVATAAIVLPELHGR